jgi:hypothetical protein
MSDHSLKDQLPKRKNETKTPKCKTKRREKAGIFS